jgi:hypothetical protein
MGEKLFVVHDSQQLSRELWQRFTLQAKTDGITVTTALAQAIEAYLRRRIDESPNS